MSRSNGMAFSTFIALLLVFGTGWPANADWKDSPFAVSRQQVDNGGADGKRPAGGFIGCQIIKGKSILPGNGPLSHVPLPNPPLPMPIGDERTELPKLPSTKSGEAP